MAEQPDEPRILLLVDGLSAFRENYEFVGNSPLFNTFLQIAADGRPVGVHIVVTGDRASSVPASLGATIQRRLILRLATEDEYVLLGAPKDILDNTSVPGRGLLEDKEIQLAVLGGSSNLAIQSRQVRRLADSMLRQNVVPAPEILRLPEQFQLRSLPAGADGKVVIGLDDESLQPRSIVPRGILMVAGPPGSGRSTALVALADSFKRSNEDSHCIYVAPGRTGIASQQIWDRVVVGIDELQDQIQLLSDLSQYGHSKVAWFFEGLTEFGATPVEADVLRLIKAAARADHWVIGESETSTWSQAWSLAQPFKSGRHGLLLSPGDMDGDTLMSTSLGKIKRGEFVPGRGHLVSRGKVHKVQVGYPDGGN
jgi:S-DNA-T family DNA segregation ATPase FtsK/SpoIIIE